MKQTVAVFLLVLAAATAAGAAGPPPVFSTYLGGHSMDVITDVTVDAKGNSYVLGTTDSPDFPFTQPWGAGRAFVAKFNPRGALVFSTRLWMGDHQPIPQARAYALTVDPNGDAIYVAGDYQPEPRDYIDYRGYVLGLMGDGSAVTFFTPYGDELATRGIDVGTDGEGRVYVAVEEDYGDFTYVLRFRPDGTRDPDIWRSRAIIRTMAVAPDGEIVTAGAQYFNPSLMFVARQGSSNWYYDFDDGYPYSPAASAALADGGAVVVGVSPNEAGENAFALRLDGSGQPVFLKHFEMDNPADMAITRDGSILVAGSNSPAGDAAVVRLDGATGEVLSSLTLGGSQGDRATGLALGTDGDLILGGITESADFPTRKAFQPAYAGLTDGFLVRLRSTGRR
jgi:hypothetical protein